MVKAVSSAPLAQLKCYNKLVVKWTNHHEEKVLGGSRLPVEKLRQVNGDEAFQEESPMVRLTVVIY